MTRAFVHAANVPRHLLFILLLSVGVLSVSVRLYYVVHAQVFQPVERAEVRGDAVDYYRYAWNVVNHGVFSKDMPDTSSAPRPDSFRDPGYPFAMAAAMVATPDYDTWYVVILLGQAVLGGLTVVLLLAASRSFLSAPWLLGAGIVAAIWPHSVAMPGYLLSETLFGFLCALAIFTSTLVLQGPRVLVAVACGIFFSFAALTNLVLLPFATLAGLALGLSRRLAWRYAITLALASLALPAAWSIRGTLSVDGATSSGRAALNLVQGSWPSLYDDYRAATGSGGNSEAGKTSLTTMDREAKVLGAKSADGIAMIFNRMRDNPWHYMAWYLTKPARLWAWDIQIGQGSIYVYPTRHSPFEENPWWAAILALSRASNGFVLLLAAGGSVYALVRRTHGSAMVFALICLFVTVIYSVFQAEPRYSVALRGPELILAAYALAALSALAKTRFRPEPVLTQT